MKVAILGGGQLARMLSLAALPLGIHTRCLDPSSQACAQDVTSIIPGQFTNPSALHAVVNNTNVVTFETENIPLQAIDHLSQTVIYPPREALVMSQDRLLEKQFCQRLGLATTAFVAVDTMEALHQGLAMLGDRCLLKTRRLGYDGKGQVLINHQTDLAEAFTRLGAKALILEAYVPFDQEVSLICVRDQHGEIDFYQLSQNEHQDGILRTSTPFVDPKLQAAAQEIAETILVELAYVGVFTIEFFVKSGQLLINEFAPRVHNSGHWTIEAAETSQFENHIRAICGFSLGSTETVGHCRMYNCISMMPDREAILSLEHCHYHHYGKAPRQGRKVGHITVTDSTSVGLARHCQQLEANVRL